MACILCELETFGNVYASPSTVMLISFGSKVEKLKENNDFAWGIRSKKKK